MLLQFWDYGPARQLLGSSSRDKPDKNAACVIHGLNVMREGFCITGEWWLCTDAEELAPPDLPTPAAIGNLKWKR